MVVVVAASAAASSSSNAGGSVPFGGEIDRYKLPRHTTISWEIEPAEATKEQWKVLQRRRRIMMETKKCPTCSGSLLEKPGPDEEDKAMVADPGSKAGSKEKMSSREEGSEFMAVLPSQGGKERMKIATEDEAMVADARSEQKLKRSREEGKRSSSGLKEKKKAKSEDKEGSGSKKKAKRSSEVFLLFSEYLSLESYFKFD
nr:uncharacterized protein LOC117835610 [Setaria viridis]